MLDTSSAAAFAGTEALLDSLMTVLRTAESQLPMMVGIVQRRLTKWKRLQHNSSAQASASGKAKTPAPQPHDASVAKDGAHRPVGGATGQTVNSTLATAALEIGNAALGVGGEHIGDYFCAEKLMWGKEWDGHDKGGDGSWKSGQPSRDIVGKLSRGGSPKDHGKLFKLSDGSNGTGIDAVWRASGRNQGKLYAIVEYKSDFERDMPAFLKKKPDTQRKPEITGKLRVSGVPQLGLDPTYLPTLEEWMSVPTRSGWGFYADHVFLDVSFAREPTLVDKAKPGSYLLTFRLMTDREHYLQFVKDSDRPRFEAVLPQVLARLAATREQREAALQAAGTKLDTSYRDPPLPR